MVFLLFRTLKKGNDLLPVLFPSLCLFPWAEARVRVRIQAQAGKGAEAGEGTQVRKRAEAG